MKNRTNRRYRTKCLFVSLCACVSVVSFATAQDYSMQRTCDAAESIFAKICKEKKAAAEKSGLKYLGDTRVSIDVESGLTHLETKAKTKSIRKTYVSCDSSGRPTADSNLIALETVDFEKKRNRDTCVTKREAVRNPLLKNCFAACNQYGGIAIIPDAVASRITPCGVDVKTKRVAICASDAGQISKEKIDTRHIPKTATPGDVTGVLQERARDEKQFETGAVMRCDESLKECRAVEMRGGLTTIGAGERIAERTIDNLLKEEKNDSLDTHLAAHNHPVSAIKKAFEGQDKNFNFDSEVVEPQALLTGPAGNRDCNTLSGSGYGIVSDPGGSWVCTAGGELRQGMRTSDYNRERLELLRASQRSEVERTEAARRFEDTYRRYFTGNIVFLPYGHTNTDVAAAIRRMNRR